MTISELIKKLEVAADAKHEASTREHKKAEGLEGDARRFVEENANIMHYDAMRLLDAVAVITENVGAEDLAA